jgi:ABC-type phosphate/phosphonate transport system substrate-binding protein/tRNA A-37 threonylcarbamoyl transferase component Bud32
MQNDLLCQLCGLDLTGRAVGGMCAICLLKLALEPLTDEEPPPHMPDENNAQPAIGFHSGEPRPARDFGDYQLFEIIGRGGMGIVYKARQKRLNRLVALKMVHNSLDASLDSLIRFRIEAEAAAKLNHPNIVPTYQIGDIDGQPFFSMKLVTGASLGRWSGEMAERGLESGGNGKPARGSARHTQVLIAVLLAKVARAVHFAHQHGVIHRDLKPNNILLDKDGEPHLTDFGIAKLLEQDLGLTRTNDVLGTPAYMAPEQAAGKAVSASVDIYSLGAIFYELLTGHPPFKGKTPLETLRKAAEEEPAHPTRMKGGADGELAAICLKCLEKNSLHRYSSALDLAEDLERWIRREPILAKRAGPFSRGYRWGRRNPMGASLIAVLFAGLAGALVLLGMVNAAKGKSTTLLAELEFKAQENGRLLSLAVGMLHSQLEGLWLNTDRRVLHISSEELAVLSGLPIPPVGNKASIERFSFGQAANESPVSDAIKYTPLLKFLEQRLTELRGHPVRIDIKMYKFKEDRAEALVTNGVDFARMGDVYFCRTQQEHPAVRALVEADTRVKKNVFFTRPDTGIKTLADVKGRTVAFGDVVAGITFWAQVKLAEAGITGNDLKDYVCFESRSEFMEEVHELGYDAALSRRGYLHSTADVIEEVVNGRYDVGVTSLRGFERHKHRGLVRIEGSEFERVQKPWVAGGSLSAEAARDFITVLTSLKNEAFLQIIPGQPSGFTAPDESAYNPIREAIQRLEGLFPVRVVPLDSQILPDDNGSRK